MLQGSALQGSVPGSKRVLDPLDRFAVNSNNVEAYYAFGVTRVPCEKEGGSTNEFTLLVYVDGRACTREVVARAVANLSEYETVGVPHNEVDLAEAAAEVSLQGFQALALQVAESEIFGVKPYSSCVSPNHGSSSASSGTCCSASSEVS